MADTQQIAERLMAIVQEVLRELHPHKAGSAAPRLDSRLDEELGFDSLGRVELLVRIEQAFDARLSEQVLASADTPRDLLRAVLAAGESGAGARPAALREVQQVQLDEVESLPDRAETLPSRS